MTAHNGIVCVEWRRPVDAVEIPLSRGLVALVDLEDRWVTQWKWCAGPRNQTGTKFYAQRSFWLPDGKSSTVRLHQAIARQFGWKIADHINGDGLDCRRQNLREASRSLNAVNRAYPPNRSGYRGVYFDKSRNPKTPWVAQIFVGGKCRNLGSFSAPERAAAAYDEAAAMAFGEFAKLNFPLRPADLAASP